MSKRKANDARQLALDELDAVIASGDVNAMLNMINTLMANGVTPTPRQIAKISAHIYKVNDANLAAEFGAQFGAFGAYNDKLAEIVLEQGSAEDNYDFAMYVPNADRVAHGKAIRKKRSKMWWMAFARMWPMEANQIMMASARGKSEQAAVNNNEQEMAQSR